MHSHKRRGIIYIEYTEKRAFIICNSNNNRDRCDTVYDHGKHQMHVEKVIVCRAPAEKPNGNQGLEKREGRQHAFKPAVVKKNEAQKKKQSWKGENRS